MQTKEVKLNVTFDLVFDGRELSIFLGDSDVTDWVKEEIGEDEFRDLHTSFLPPAPPDPLDLAKEHSLEAGSL